MELVISRGTTFGVNARGDTRGKLAKKWNFVNCKTVQPDRNVKI